MTAGRLGSASSTDLVRSRAQHSARESLLPPTKPSTEAGDDLDTSCSVAMEATKSAADSAARKVEDERLAREAARAAAKKAREEKLQREEALAAAKRASEAARGTAGSESNTWPQRQGTMQGSASLPSISTFNKSSSGVHAGPSSGSLRKGLSSAEDHRKGRHKLMGRLFSEGHSSNPGTGRSGSSHATAKFSASTSNWLKNLEPPKIYAHPLSGPLAQGNRTRKGDRAAADFHPSSVRSANIPDRPRTQAVANAGMAVLSAPATTRRQQQQLQQHVVAKDFGSTHRSSASSQRGSAASTSRDRERWTEYEKLSHVASLGYVKLPQEEQVLCFLYTAMCDARLPAGWQVTRDQNGRVYFANPLTGASSWSHPLAAQLEELAGIFRMCQGSPPDVRELAVDTLLATWQDEARVSLSPWKRSVDPVGMQCFQNQDTQDIVYIDPAETILPQLYIKAVAMENLRKNNYEVRLSKIRHIVEGQRGAPQLQLEDQQQEQQQQQKQSEVDLLHQQLDVQQHQQRQAQQAQERRAQSQRELLQRERQEVETMRRQLARLHEGGASQSQLPQQQLALPSSSQQQQPAAEAAAPQDAQESDRQQKHSELHSQVRAQLDQLRAHQEQHQELQRQLRQLHQVQQEQQERDTVQLLQLQQQLWRHGEAAIQMPADAGDAGAETLRSPVPPPTTLSALPSHGMAQAALVR